MLGINEGFSQGKTIAAGKVPRPHAGAVTQLYRRIGRVALLCAALSMIAVSGVAAQTQQYSFSPEYRSLLEELQDNPVRPSRTGTLLTTPQQPLQLNVHEDASTLRLEASGWQLNATAHTLRVAFQSGDFDLRITP